MSAWRVQSATFFFALLLISLRTSSSERRLSLLSWGSDNGVRSSERDCSVCSMLSSLRPMVSIFWTKKIPIWFASSLPSSTEGGYTGLLSPWLRSFFAVETNCADCCYFPNEVMIEFASSFIHQSVSIVLFSFTRQHIFPKASATPPPFGLSAFRFFCLAALISQLNWDKWPTANHFRTQWCMPVKSLSQGLCYSKHFLSNLQARLNTFKSVLVLS